MKTTKEQVLAAVDGEMCEEQAEKLRIIRFHMDSLRLCKLDLEWLILETAEKYLHQLSLVMTAHGIQSFVQSASSLKSEWICPCSPPRGISALGLGLHRKTTKVPGRRKLPESAGLEPTSNRYLFNSPSMRFAPRNFRKSAIAILHSRNAEATKKPSSPLPGCF